MRNFAPPRLSHLIAVVACSLMLGSANAQSVYIEAKCECPVKVVPWFSTNCLLLPQATSSSFTVSVLNSPVTVTPPAGNIVYGLDFYYPAVGGSQIFSWNCSSLAWTSTPSDQYCDPPTIEGYNMSIYGFKDGTHFGIDCRRH